jgi:hypothetical protein
MSTSVARLTAREGEPLADDRVRATVVSAAQAIAERFGVRVIRVATDGRSIEVELEAGELAAIGFAAELRRLTNRWAAGRRLAPLWPEPPAHGDDGYDGWLSPQDRGG